MSVPARGPVRPQRFCAELLDDLTTVLRHEPTLSLVVGLEWDLRGYVLVNSGQSEMCDRLTRELRDAHELYRIAQALQARLRAFAATSIDKVPRGDWTRSLGTTQRRLIRRLCERHRVSADVDDFLRALQKIYFNADLTSPPAPLLTGRRQINMRNWFIASILGRLRRESIGVDARRKGIAVGMLRVLLTAADTLEGRRRPDGRWYEHDAETLRKDIRAALKDPDPDAIEDHFTLSREEIEAWLDARAREMGWAAVG